MSLRKLARWVKSNADAVTALVGGGLIGLIAMVDLDLLGDERTNAAVLLVLALLATAVLRDRQLAEQAARQNADVRVLHGTEVRDELNESRRTTDEWLFRGGTGTYLRAVTMPECVDRARKERKSMRFQIEILDPTNDKVCSEYAELRISMSPGPDGTGEPWTPARVRKEAYATILAACVHMQTYAFLRVELGLTSKVPALRWDMSSRSVVETQEDPHSPALMILGGSPLYTNYRRELDLSFQQARRVPFSKADDVRLSEEPTHDEVRELFKSLQIELPSTLTQHDVSDIIRRAIRPRNPYP